MTVRIWTDAGGDNPGRTAWAAILVFGDQVRVIGDWIRHSTINYTEAFAVVQALKQVRFPSQVEIFTDSQYTVNGVLRFICRKSPLKTNVTVWNEFWVVARQHDISVQYTPGHQNDVLNIIADNYASYCLSRKSLDFRTTLGELLAKAPQKRIR